MGGQRKRVPAESSIPDQKALIEVLLLACQENKVATSSTERLPGVRGPWLHNIKIGKQASTDLANVFPLLEALGLEMVIRNKRKVNRVASGTQAAGRLLAARATKRAASAVEVTLSPSERAEIAQVMADMNEVASSELPPELIEARKMLAA